jgi:hypothetical protein
MDPKIKHIKKEDRNGSPPPVDDVATDDPKEWSAVVKSWVKESKVDRRETLETFDSVFSNPKR